MKTLPFLLVLLLAATSAEAVTFRGNILEILEPGAPGTQPDYQGGQTYLGWYEYDSDAIDGSFGTPGAFDSPGNDTLDGSLLLPFTTCATGTFNGEPVEYHDGFGATVTSLANTPNQGLLTVAGGHVVSFDWSWEVGGFYAHCGTTQLLTLNDYDRLDNPPENGARIIFSDPHHVPDAASTASLLLVALMALWPVRRPWRAR